MNTINIDTVLMIKGKKTTMQNFMTKYGVDNEERAIQLATALVKKGKATIHVDKSEEVDIVNMLDNDIQLANIVNSLDAEEYNALQAKRDDMKEDVDLVSIQLSFTTSNEAVIAEQYINDMGVEDTEITMKKGAIYLKVKDITPQEYSKIATKYQLEKAINTGLQFTSKTVKSATDAVNFAATKVIAPTAKIAGEAGMNLGKGLVHTGAKVGAGLVNSGSKAITDTKVALATDSEMIRAKKELIDAKDSAVSFFKKKINKNKKRSGIEML